MRSSIEFAVSSSKVSQSTFFSYVIIVLISDVYCIHIGIHNCMLNVERSFHTHAHIFICIDFFKLIISLFIFISRM